MVDNIIEVLNACIDQSLPERQKGSEVDNSAKIFRLIKKTIDYIGKEVIFQGEAVQLSWSHVEPYLYSQIPDGEDLYQYIDSVFLHRERKVTPNLNMRTIVFKKKEEQTSIAYVDFLQHILPVKNTEYPKIINNQVILLFDQLVFCNRFVVDRKGNFSLRCLDSIQYNDMLLKTLRADEFDFSYQFILGIIPGENNARRLHNLRYVKRQPYTITPMGRIARRVNKQPQNSPEEKQSYSQIQSCTLIDEKALSPAFGFTKTRKAKLYGLMTSTRDALISRLLVDDSGTVTRIFDHTDEQGARASEAYVAYQDNLFYPKNKMPDFKDKNVDTRQHSHRTNEVLARLRFNPYRSVVSICSDTLETRLLAYDFAQELLEYYRVYVESSGATLDPNFKIPIIFYIPKSAKTHADSMHELHHEIKLYTNEMLKEDQEQAWMIYSNDLLRSQFIKNRDYEFLLALPREALKNILYECVYCRGASPQCEEKSSRCSPLALAMIDNNYTRMLSRLLRTTQDDDANANGIGKQSCREELVNFLVNNHFIEKNDRVIAKLILAEEFDFADLFIAKTGSDKYQLNIVGGSLVTELINRGNPRQLNYMGLDKMLILAAENNSWVVITLCLKEYPNLSKTLLGELLVSAANGGPQAVVDRLLKMGADTSIQKAGRVPISDAAVSCDWGVLWVFACYPTDPEDRSEYGYALIEALRCGKPGLAKLLLQAGAKPAWRGHGYQQYQLRSTLFFAVKYGFNALLPQLIEHEQQYHDVYSATRYGVALGLAYLQDNQEAIELLETNDVSMILFDPVNIAASICRRVLEVFAVISVEQIADAGHAEKIAEQTLLRYCYQHRLLTQHKNSVAKPKWDMMSFFNPKPIDINCRQVVDGLRIIMPHFFTALKSLPSSEDNCVVERIIKWLLLYKEPSLFGYITDISCFDEEAARNKFRGTVVTTILKELSLDNKNMIIKLVDLYFTEGPWKTTWQAGLDKEFAYALRNGDRSAFGILLLYEFGPALPEDLVVIFFDRAISINSMRFAETLLNDPHYSDEIKEKLLRGAIEWEKLSDKRIILMMKNNFNVTPEMVRFSALHGRKDLLLHLLDTIQKNKYSMLGYQWHFFSTFHYSLFGDFKVERKLSNLLGPSLIRHFMLIDLLLLFKESNTLAKTWKTWSLVNFIWDNGQGGRFWKYVYENHDKMCGYNQKILHTLDVYFADVETMPNEHIILQTYKTILGQFESLLKVNSPNIIRYDKHYPEINFKVVYRHMKKLDELLSQCEEELRQNIGDRQPLLEDPSWAKDPTLPQFF